MPKKHPDLVFAVRLHRPRDHDGAGLVLLHGTGGSEGDLLPLGERVAPRAALLGVRGRSTDEGAPRWFRRLDATHFDQADIRAEADAFAAFLPRAVASSNLEAQRVTLLGYSNGANFIAAMMLLHPGLVRRAVLLRPMLVLDAPPAADLSNADVLMIAGTQDPYGQFAPALDATLRARGAKVQARTVQAGHDLRPDDASIAHEWLATRDHMKPGLPRVRHPGVSA